MAGDLEPGGDLLHLIPGELADSPEVHAHDRARQLRVEPYGEAFVAGLRQPLIALSSLNSLQSQRGPMYQARVPAYSGSSSWQPLDTTPKLFSSASHSMRSDEGELKMGGTSHLFHLDFMGEVLDGDGGGLAVSVVEDPRRWPKGVAIVFSASALYLLAGNIFAEMIILIDANEDISELSPGHTNRCKFS
ncbi:hypothetical protein J5N97_015347 [Dioscorea zingiberensis]|uniref:Uncharacterized protein n=1 Tax=Dioscorea zingiberensis TaxID=325984 RepID=A0A9D5CV68_9LILI|nr:hypothetical protein J5N97_015347 [Dioscorea zingiberensis]